MKINPLSLARILVILLPLLGTLLGLSIRLWYPLWLAALAGSVALTLIVWYKQGHSFKPLVPLTLVIIGALVVVALWVYS